MNLPSGIETLIFIITLVIIIKIIKLFLNSKSQNLKIILMKQSQHITTLLIKTTLFILITTLMNQADRDVYILIVQNVKDYIMQQEHLL